MHPYRTHTCAELRLDDAGANPGVLCLACDVGERLDRDGAAVLRCRDDGH